MITWEVVCLEGCRRVVVASLCVQYHRIHNSPLKGIGVRDFYDFFDFFLLAGRFSIGCGSKFRAEVAYLEVGSSDLEPIHEKHVFR